MHVAWMPRWFRLRTLTARLCRRATAEENSRPSICAPVGLVGNLAAVMLPLENSSQQMYGVKPIPTCLQNLRLATYQRSVISVF